jgi:L-seryl-tRNA(Ser) seleniumtransferase
MSLLDELSRLPSVESLVDSPALPHIPRLRAVRVRIIRQYLDEVRACVKAGGSVPERARLIDHLGDRFTKLTGGGIRRAINATGVILHTNLGRAPIGPEILTQLAQDLAGYSTTELDLENGERGSRTAHVESLLRFLLDCEDALVVNNNAAAVMLALHGLAKDKATAISRGEMVQIGGGFRIPDVLVASGTTLLEVGTTNITRSEDYRAVAERAGALLKVHRSNFAMVGHTEDVSIKALSLLAREFSIPLILDLGSGRVSELRWDLEELSVRDALRSGADVVCFSGDKLLGGPQAGIIVGATRWLEILKRTPLYRALRLSKLELYVLEKTLRGIVCGEGTATSRLMETSVEDLRKRAEILAERLRQFEGVRVQALEGCVGGGTLPDRTIASFGIAVKFSDANRVAKALLRGEPPIISRRQEGELLFDLRTVFVEEDAILADQIERVILCMS